MHFSHLHISSSFSSHSITLSPLPPLLSVRTSRKSVSEEDLAEYASFAYKMKRMAEEVTETGSSMSKFSFANNPNKK